jgi:hypothetical protein
MAPNSKTLKLKIILIKKASSMNFWHPILHNKMGWLKERIGHSLSRQGQWLMSTRPLTAIGPQLSTRRATPLTDSDEKLGPDLPRGTNKSIGGDLNIDDDDSEQNFKLLQSIHHYSIGYQSV